MGAFSLLKLQVIFSERTIFSLSLNFSLMLTECIIVVPVSKRCKNIYISIKLVHSSYLVIHYALQAYNKIMEIKPAIINILVLVQVRLLINTNRILEILDIHRRQDPCILLIHQKEIIGKTLLIDIFYYNLLIDL